MRRRIVALVCLFLFSFSGLNAQKYEASLIPDSLSRNADAVIRELNFDLDVKSEKHAEIKRYEAITILNANGDKYARFNLPYDKSMVPREYSIKIIDQTGLKIKHVKTSDIHDIAAYPEDVAMFADDRLLTFQPAVNSYPYTVVFEYSVVYNGFLTLPSIQPIYWYNLALEKATYTIHVSEGYKFSFHECNIPPQASDVSSSPNEYSWRLNAIKPFKDEYLGLHLNEVVPSVYLFPESVYYDGFSGTFDNWNSLGKWVSSLLNGRDELPSETISYIHGLTDTIKGNLQKAKVLYEFLQDKVRYVSIQLGIGGFQPFSAEMVDKLGYGDCKALSNYYVSLLKAIGIHSIYCVTRLDDQTGQIFPEHPSLRYFNHAMVCIPDTKDSVWVECTNPFIPFGFVGWESFRQPVLLISEQGGKLSTISSYGTSSDLLARSYEIIPAANGSATISVRQYYLGRDMDEGLAKYLQSRKDQEKYLYGSMKLNDFTITNFEYRYDKVHQSVTFTGGIQCNNFASISGKRMILPVILKENQLDTPENILERQTPFEIVHEYNFSDTLQYRICPGYKIESLPGNTEMSNRFGKFSIKLQASDSMIQVIISSNLNAGKYKPSDYPEFNDFILSALKAENQKIILKSE